MRRRTDILISANSRWNLVNFRRGLVEELIRAGFRVTAVAPIDGGSLVRSDFPCEIIDIAIDRSGVNPGRDLMLASSYYRLLRKLRPAAYLSFTIKPNIYGALAARWAGVHSLPNVSGLGTAFINDSLLTRFVVRLYAAAFRHSPTVFFQNPDDRDLFVERGIVTAAQVRLLPGSGIDLDHFRPDPNPESGPPVFLFIGRLLADKGVREYVEAARMLKSQLPDARFQLLGPIDGGNRTAVGREELRRMVEQGAIEYLGETDDVRPFIHRATAIVLPSYREGLPRTLLEGAALARPLVATDVPGNREIVIDGVTGLLCEARDASSLADALRRMADLDPARRAAMGQAGREMVERSFSENLVIQSYLDALKQLSAFKGA